MLSSMIKKEFGRNEVNILIPADASSLTVRSTNAKTYKINGPILKLFSKVQIKDKLKEAYLFFEKTFLVIN